LSAFQRVWFVDFYQKNVHYLKVSAIKRCPLDEVSLYRHIIISWVRWIMLPVAYSLATITVLHRSNKTNNCSWWTDAGALVDQSWPAWCWYYYYHYCCCYYCIIWWMSPTILYYSDSAIDNTKHNIMISLSIILLLLIFTDICC